MSEKDLEQILRDSGKIKLEPLKQWYCDHCNEVIDSAENGWLEWLKDKTDNKEHSFRIVHHDKNCMYNEREEYRRNQMTQDMHLDHYTGADGLNRLLAIMTRNNVVQSEVIEIIRRLHIPFYEQSLLYRSIALEDGYFSSDPESYTNVMDNLNLIDAYSNED